MEDNDNKPVKKIHAALPEGHNLTPKQTLKVMAEVANTVGARQGIPNVLTQGWKRQLGNANEE